MELDDFKNLKAAKPIAENTEKEPLKTNHMESLIEQLKKNDTRDKNALFYLIIMFFIFIGLYIVISRNRSGELRDAYGLLILAFIMGIVYSFYGLLKLRKVDYTEPVQLFLRKALKRNRFMKLEDWVLTLPILTAFFVGGFLTVRYTFMKYLDNTLIPEIIFAAIFFAALSVGSWASYKKWKENKAPLLAEIRKKLSEFDTE